MHLSESAFSKAPALITVAKVTSFPSVGIFTYRLSGPATVGSVNTAWRLPKSGLSICQRSSSMTAWAGRHLSVHTLNDLCTAVIRIWSWGQDCLPATRKYWFLKSAHPADSLYAQGQFFKSGVGWQKRLLKAKMHTVERGGSIIFNWRKATRSWSKIGIGNGRAKRQSLSTKFLFVPSHHLDASQLLPEIRPFKLALSHAIPRVRSKHGPEDQATELDVSINLRPWSLRPIAFIREEA